MSAGLNDFGPLSSAVARKMSGLRRDDRYRPMRNGDVTVWRRLNRSAAPTSDRLPQDPGKDPQNNFSNISLLFAKVQRAVSVSVVAPIQTSSRKAGALRVH